MISKNEIYDAMRSILPSMNAETVSFKTLLGLTAKKIGVEVEELKKWRVELKTFVAENLELCGTATKNHDENKENSEKTPQIIKSNAKSSFKKRNVIEESDESEEDEVSSEDITVKRIIHDNESEEDEEENDSEEEEKPKKVRKRTSKSAKRKATQSSQKPVKKAKIPPTQDPEGLAALKEMARIGGLLGPNMYRKLKEVSSTEEAEDILRDRLHDSGIRFSGTYPKKQEIVALKKKKDLEKEMDGIDTNLIITSSRRRAVARPSFIDNSKYEDTEESNEENGSDKDVVKEENEEDDASSNSTEEEEV